MSASSSSFFTNVVAVIIGIFSALAVFFLLIICCFYMGFAGWTDGGTKEQIHSLEIRTTISLIVAGVIGILIGGFISRYISAEDEWLPVIITGIFLTAISSLGYEAGPGTGILLILTFPVTLAGGWLGRRKPVRQLNKKPFPFDIL